MEHSRKPDEIYDRIERLVTGPYLELFARRERHNWVTWGNELAFKPPLVWGMRPCTKLSRATENAAVAHDNCGKA
jgi:hypothetical protein